MKYIVLWFLLFFIISCWVNNKEELIQNTQSKLPIILEENKSDNLIKKWEINKTLILSDNDDRAVEKITFKQEVENNTIYLFSRERIKLNSVDDVIALKDFLEYWKQYDNLIIKKIMVTIPYNIYNQVILNELIDLFEWNSLHLSVTYTSSDKYIPITTENIEKIMSHEPPAFFSFTSNFSQYPWKEDLNKLMKVEYENIEQFEEEYFNNWDSENSIVFFWKYPVQKR